MSIPHPPDTVRKVKEALLRTGFYSAFRRVAPSRNLAILRYHAVCETDAGYADPGICVTPAGFEEHVRYLAAHYRVLALPEAVDALRRGSSLPRNAVAITFDDGYADNYAAAQTLAAHGLTATFYITAGCLADGAPFWPSEIRKLVHALRVERLELDVAGAPVTIPVSTPAERQAAVSKLTKIFKGHTNPDSRVGPGTAAACAGAVPAPSPMLTREQLDGMRRLGMEIGSHTFTHPNLPNAGLEEARRELRESKRALEACVGAP
jgi:peptidoglycan/xylan/chitin deacetylase (PgdA/CDA1 family)